MRFIDNGGIHDPTINLAIEEYAVTHLDLKETYLLFYINQPSIIIGRNQNTFEEVHQEYVRDHGIHVVRRLSGGGAVYHDLGNLNFSFITQNDTDSFRNFARFTKPVIDALQSLGVDAQLSGRNDIQIGDKKISGNAQFTTSGRMFSHGTLMFDVDLDEVSRALHVSQEKMQSKGIKSVRSRVANIRDYLRADMGIEKFRDMLLSFIFPGGSVPEYRLTNGDWEGIRRIAEQRYRNWDWNYGRSPEFDVRYSKRFTIGSIDVRLRVKDGVIAECKIYGDFFGIGDVSDVENRLVGSRFEYDHLRRALQGLDVRTYFGDIAEEEFLTLFE